MRRSAGAAIRDSGAPTRPPSEEKSIRSWKLGPMAASDPSPIRRMRRPCVSASMVKCGLRARPIASSSAGSAESPGCDNRAAGPMSPCSRRRILQVPCWPDSYEYLIDPFRLTRFPCIRRSFTLGKPLNEIWRYGEQQIGSHLQYAIGSARLVMDVVCVGMRMSRISELPRPPAQETVRVRKA